MTPQRKRKLKKLAGLMKQQNQSSLPVTEPLLALLDWAITPQETDFLLTMGTAPMTYEQALRSAPG